MWELFQHTHTHIYVWYFCAHTYENKNKLINLCVMWFIAINIQIVPGFSASKVLPRLVKSVLWACMPKPCHFGYFVSKCTRCICRRALQFQSLFGHFWHSLLNMFSRTFRNQNLTNIVTMVNAMTKLMIENKTSRPNLGTLHNSS